VLARWGIRIGMGLAGAACHNPGPPVVD